MANTIYDKLEYLEDTKEQIKQAIVAKGVSVSDEDTFRSYADKIEAIETGGSIAEAPSSIKFGYSTFTTVPVEILPYLEQQTNMSEMFRSCTKLTTIPLFNTSNVTSMSSMFRSCTKLTTIPLFNTSNVTNMSTMFYTCTSLQTVPLFDTSNVTIMSTMFSGCTKLTTVPLFDTSNVTNMSTMFSVCTKLTTVPLFDTSNVTSMSSMFSGCSSLTNLGGFTGLKKNLDLSSSPLLTVDSVMNVINNAADMTSSPKTLTLHQDVFNKLSEEQIATASAKGWNIAKK